MPGYLDHSKGEFYWKAAAQNDSRDDLVAKCYGMIFQSLTPLQMLVFKSFRMRRLNVVAVTIMFHGWDKNRWNGNTSKVIS